MPNWSQTPRLSIHFDLYYCILLEFIILLWLKILKLNFVSGLVLTVSPEASSRVSCRSEYSWGFQFQAKWQWWGQYVYYVCALQFLWIQWEWCLSRKLKISLTLSYFCFQRVTDRVMEVKNFFSWSKWFSLDSKLQIMLTERFVSSKPFCEFPSALQYCFGWKEIKSLS